MQTVDAAGLGIGDGHPPRIMGVLNVSQESPYDPSVHDDPAEAAAYVDRELIDEGADIVDVGLESANKRYEVLPPEEELARLDAAVETVASVSGDAVFSIETRYAEVAEAALSRGFDVVNDVCGFADPRMPAVCAEFDAAVVKMASPPDLKRPGALSSVDEVFAALRRDGFTEKTIVDPAFGGWSEDKTLADDRETFRHLREFRALGRPILVSINRKNFLRDLADRSTEDALPVSLAATAMAVERGADVIRTHDVAETRDAAVVGDAFAPDRPSVRSDSRRDDDVTVAELDATPAADAARHVERVGGDPASGREFVGRAFLVEGLDEADRAALAEAAAATGAAAVEGADGAAVLGGSEAALTATARELSGDSGLAAALRRALD